MSVREFSSCSCCVTIAVAVFVIGSVVVVAAGNVAAIVVDAALAILSFAASLFCRCFSTVDVSAVIDGFASACCCCCCC